MTAIIPIFSLPTELLADIFVLAANVAESSSATQSSIVSTCRRFHNIAVDTPLLWTRLCLPIPLFTADKWLDRSGSLPLTVELVPTGTPLEQLSALKAFLIRRDVLARCTRLIVSKCGHFLVDVLSRPAPALRAIEIEFCGPHDEDYDCEVELWDDEWVLDLLKGETEALRHVRLREVPFKWTRAPFRDLTSLSIAFPSAFWAIQFPTFAQFLDTLAACPGLRFLSLENLLFDEIINGTPAPRVNHEVVRLVSLEQLTLSGPTLCDARLWLHFLKVSPLCHLTFEACGEFHLAEDFPLPRAPAFFADIRHVSFRGAGDVDRENAETLLDAGDDFFVISPDKILGHLQQMPVLETLNIELLRLDDRLLAALTVYPERTNIVPSLKTIRIIGCHGFTSPTLARMMSSRTSGSVRGVARLKCVIVDLCPIMPPGRSYLDVDDFWNVEEEEQRLMWHYNYGSPSPGQV